MQAHIHFGVRFREDEYREFLQTLEKAREVYPFTKGSLVRHLLANPAIRDRVLDLIRRYPPRIVDENQHRYRRFSDMLIRTFSVEDE